MGMRAMRGLVAVLLVASLANCATPYQEAGFFSMRGGYKQQELEPGVWRVTFGGNGYTTHETVQTYWLYRCAELTLDKGYDGFEILSNLDLVGLPPQQPSIIPAAGPIYVPLYMDGPWKPQIIGDIRLLKQPFTARPPRSFDARELKAELEPHVKKICGSNVCPHVHRYLFEREQKPQTPGQDA